MLAVNSELIVLYWGIGRGLLELESAVLNDVQSFLMERCADDRSHPLSGRGRTVTEWALRGIDTPVAVARYKTADKTTDVTLTQTPPPEMQSALPDLPALASELTSIVEAADTA